MSYYSSSKQDHDIYMSYLKDAGFVNNPMYGEYSATEWCARIERGSLWYEDNQECSIDSPEFQTFIDCDWVIVVKSLEVDIVVTRNFGNKVKTETPLDMHMTLRAEVRGLQKHWSAYRKQNGQLKKVYLGKCDRVTKDAIVLAAKRMAGFVDKDGNWL